MSDTLLWRIGKTKVDKATVYVTTVWMADPGRQIGKAAADWRKNVMQTADIANGRTTDISVKIRLLPGKNAKPAIIAAQTKESMDTSTE